VSPAWILFIIGTAAILVFSWRFSIRAKRYHGLARFFAFESILVLLILNARHWFREPLTPIHLASWMILIASIPPVAWGTLLLVRQGRPDGQLENTTRLVTSGIYRLIRHPLYLSVGLFGIGVYLKNVTLETSLLAIVLAAAVILTALIEEGEMKARFGESYAAYMKTTKRFIPGVF
jgi:protein-S-isoprenylcysteine O-methyltransferase Ste14